MSSHKEECLQQNTVMQGKVITVTVDSVRLENGETSVREVVHHHGGAAVIALTRQNEVYVVRQYRYALQQELLEIPAGKLEPGEDPFDAAKRELEEEAGVTADEYLPLGYMIPTCGYCTEKIYLYAAKGLHKTQQHLDADEFLDAETMPLQTLEQMALRGELPDGKTCLAVLKLAALRREGRF